MSRVKPNIFRKMIEKNHQLMKQEREPIHQCTQYQVVHDLLNLTYQIEVVGFYYNDRILQKKLDEKSSNKETNPKFGRKRVVLIERWLNWPWHTSKGVFVINLVVRAIVWLLLPCPTLSH